MRDHASPRCSPLCFSWNNAIFPLVLSNQATATPIGAVGRAPPTAGASWNYIAATAIALAMLPPMLIFLALGARCVCAG